MKTGKESYKVNGIYEFFILGLCIIALIAMGIETFTKVNEETARILKWMDWCVCGIFLFDFIYTLARSQNRLRYMITWGWIDLLSSIPAVDILRFGRLARVFRIFRLLRGLRAARILASFTLRQRAQSAFLATTLFTIVLINTASIAILQLETQPGSNIKNASDAVWWSITTLTTVGYGDKYPITDLGRLIGVALMISGVGLFGTLSGFMASWLISPTKAAKAEESACEHAD